VHLVIPDGLTHWDGAVNLSAQVDRIEHALCVTVMIVEGHVRAATMLLSCKTDNALVLVLVL
jgi:hypothetical protein